MVFAYCTFNIQTCIFHLSSSSEAFIEYNDIKNKKWRTSERDWPVVVWGNVVDAVVVTIVYLVVAAAGGASVSHIHSGWGVVGGGGSVPCTRKGGRSERAWSVKNTANHKGELNNNRRNTTWVRDWCKIKYGSNENHNIYWTMWTHCKLLIYKYNLHKIKLDLNRVTRMQDC